MTAGKATFFLGEDSCLTVFQDHAVVALGPGGDNRTWTVKPFGDSGGGSQLYTILLGGKDPADEQLCLTLNIEGGGNENNIMVEKLDTPRPKTTQLWTFEEPISPLRLPPLVLARIQSVARPWLSAAVGGNLPLPKIMQNIAGCPNEPGSQEQKWRIDYMPVEE